MFLFPDMVSIFGEYKFELQKFFTNDLSLRHKLGQQEDEKEVELFGIMWNLETDMLKTKPIVLEKLANTKRSILQTIAQNFDPFNFSGPILNRA